MVASIRRTFTGESRFATVIHALVTSHRLLQHILYGAALEEYPELATGAKNAVVRLLEKAMW